MLTRFRLGLRIFVAACAMLAAFVVMTATPGSAEIKKVMLKRLGKLQPLFLPQLPTPAGWSFHQSTSGVFRVTVLVPTGSDFRSAEAKIYGVADYNADKTTIDSRARNGNDTWLSNGMNRSVERLADVARDKGGPAFQVFRYRYPSDARQTAEIVAFGEDTDKEGNLYSVQIVLSAKGDKGLADNKDAFVTVLKNY